MKTKVTSVITLTNSIMYILYEVQILKGKNCKPYLTIERLTVWWEETDL